MNRDNVDARYVPRVVFFTCPILKMQDSNLVDIKHDVDKMLGDHVEALDKEIAKLAAQNKHQNRGAAIFGETNEKITKLRTRRVSFTDLYAKDKPLTNQ